jgi:hypothetical protein
MKLLAQLCVSLASLLGCGGGPRVTPSIYLVPDGFSGWVMIEFEVAGAPPLPSEDGQRLFIVPRDGTLQTSSPQELGRIVKERYYFLGSDGRRTPIPKPADPNAAYAAHPEPRILGSATRIETGDGQDRLFDLFYVGHGPAGDPP